MKETNSNTSRLLALADQPLGRASGSVPARFQGVKIASLLTQELVALLDAKNGFYAFDSALLLRPRSSGEPPLGISQWNANALWKNNYKMDLSGVLCFAEDVFGGQFCAKDDAVSYFEPETGELTTVANSIDDWARWILDEHELKTGAPIAHAWQRKHGPLKPGKRLLPSVPFVLGGKYVIENLYEIDDVEGMRFRASIANQLEGVPDGANIQLSLKPNR